MVKEIIKRKHINKIIGELDKLREADLTVTQTLHLVNAFKILKRIKDELPI